MFGAGKNRESERLSGEVDALKRTARALTENVADAVG